MCGQAKPQTAQIPGNEPFGICPQLLGERKFPLPGSGSPEYRSLPSPSPFYVFQSIVRGVAFAAKSALQFGSGTRPLVVDTLAEMPEAQIHRACPSSRDYTRTYPTRACTQNHSLKLNSRIRNSFPSFPALFYFSFFFELREISSCSCIRDMQKLFYFVVGDFRFL